MTERVIFPASASTPGTDKAVSAANIVAYSEWQEHFRPELFSLDPRADNFSLDQEVASIIANAFYHSDEEGQGGNNWFNPAVVIDPTGQTNTHALRPEYDRGHGDDGIAEDGYRLSFKFQSPATANQMFARELQKALFAGERRNRMKLTASIGSTVLLASVIEGFPAAVALGTDIPTSAKIGIFASTNGLLGPLIKYPFYHFYRLNVIKPGTRLNERYLRSAEAAANRMYLPPVIRPKE